MAREGGGRFEFGWFGIFGMFFVFTAGSVVIFFLGIYVGKGLQESRLAREERVVRLPVTQGEAARRVRARASRRAAPSMSRRDSRSRGHRERQSRRAQCGRAGRERESGQWPDHGTAGCATPPRVIAAAASPTAASRPWCAARPPPTRFAKAGPAARRPPR